LFPSPGELNQSLLYSRLQTRLNPVPESLNSPDIAPPSSASLGRARCKIYEANFLPERFSAKCWCGQNVFTRKIAILSLVKK
jgi:hypothetical protein